MYNSNYISRIREFFINIKNNNCDKIVSSLHNRIIKLIKFLVDVKS